MADSSTLVCFRHDLRLDDNPALTAAAARGGPIVCVFIMPPDDEEGLWPAGGAARWWLHHSLEALSRSLEQAGNRLILRRGPSKQVLDALLADTGADAVLWNRRYEPAAIARDTEMKRWLIEDRGVSAVSHNGALLHEPWTIQTQAGKAYTVYTPFSKSCLAAPPPAPLPAPARLPLLRKAPASESLQSLGLLPTRDWADGFSETCQPGEAGAAARLRQFLAQAAESYGTERDRPDRPGTSRLSAHLHFGEVSPRRIWQALADLESSKRGGGSGASIDAYRRELLWREFAHHLLYHFPQTTSEPLRSQYAAFPWRDDPAGLQLWQRGRTGYPIVDAGMRELWRTGWMHNRVRMIVASFLVKDLLIPWQAGAKWFWDTLVDADLANNTLGWQWTAGCGADAAPYFRIFNPVSQGRKFDPQGAYVRRWCPELAKLPDEWIHEPWAASPQVMGRAGVRLGRDYPEPVVDHAMARQRALDALKRITKK